ncbi:hypothetical protein SEA_FORZA_71 [Gordonia phage Forza]|uniref:Uncharacterized protein n=1 Tax=Gordonia phage Forza TaxID=2571247 RepID=A0A650EYC9_9CAUD|nr:hypothetical protein PP303_gp071 [Gordonia phage Forza]QEM41540.1 hypothetical protein SEA_BOOPY_71 [Gordonia phage Boopy]QGT55064.1 hypothetical protein SEA_FORZA_71 [Gordonia phage Forza]UXE04213.1 hypothetical protein SEA_BLUENGOLD_69 [Gordonia phage BlueNGold]WBF03852.1 hypothetical protein SEA_MAREELIH_69 [Gordonia phage Mareelih]
MELADFIEDGQVQVAASVFPVSLQINDVGRSPVRFMLLKHPSGDWWAAAWGSSTGAQPAQVLWGKVARVNRIDIYLIDIELEDGKRVLSSPSSGGCCGNRLRSWNPFDTQALLVHAPYSKVITDSQ